MPARGIAWMIAIAAISFLLAAPRLGADQVVIFGDSLSKEYEVEFAPDGYPSSVRNWIEILDNKRKPFFDYGSFSTFLDQRAVGHEYNWSIPGAEIRDFVEIVRGNTNEFWFPFRKERQIIAPQLQLEAERFVLFVGGNDADGVYGTAYAGGDLSAWIAQFVTDTEEVLDWVLAVNPSLPSVLVGVPHVGITPKVKAQYPPDPVMTGNATAVYAELNRQLENLAAAKGIAFMDVFELTLELLDEPSFCYHGVSFFNAGNSGGSLDYAWLGGSLADNFHPNTNGMAVIANAIVEAFNEFYGAGIEWLSTEEILDDLLGKNPDVSFEDWLACFGFAGGLPTDDPDGDGFCHFAEFGLGMDPRVANLARAPRFSVGLGGTAIELTYRPRLDRPSTVVEVMPQSSTGLVGWTDAAGGQIAENADGSLTVSFPVTGPSLYERVVVRALGP